VQDVIIPALGMAMTEAVLTRWYKEPGEAVAAGEVIAEIETDKSAVDLESPADGILGPHLVGEGAEVPVGAAVTQVLDGAAPAGADAGPIQHDAAPVPSEAAPVPSEAAPAQTPAAPAPGGPPAETAAPAVAPAAPVTAPASAGTGPARDADGFVPKGPATRAPHKLSPRKRMQARLAAEAAARANGGEGSPAAPEQVVSAPAPVSPPAAPPPAAGGLTGRRAAVAQAVAESWRTIPHFSVQREIDASDADACLAAMRARAPEATYTDLLLRAFALAVNSIGQRGSDLGLAVATPDGVMMPIISGVPDLDVPGLVAARKAATKRGREGRLAAGDLAGPAVAAISNLGARGVDSFTGIVPTGRRLLLTTGRIAGRPVVVDGRLGVRATLIATLNVDHRYLDGDRTADVLDVFDREFRALRSWAGEGDQ
jgi:pyruvate dehydrogenase E2 component (dihydrolipoamide acetyltransferase)